jgi:hypothetical protein
MMVLWKLKHVAENKIRSEQYWSIVKSFWRLLMLHVLSSTRCTDRTRFGLSDCPWNCCSWLVVAMFEHASLAYDYRLHMINHHVAQTAKWCNVSLKVRRRIRISCQSSKKNLIHTYPHTLLQWNLYKWVPALIRNYFCCRKSYTENTHEKL